MLPLRSMVVVLTLAIAVAVAMLVSQSGGASGGDVGGDKAVAVPALPGATAAQSSQAISGLPSPAKGSAMMVHVAGAVKSPGIVRLQAGARVFQAIEAAGGATGDADLAAVNLAALAVDGTQVFIPVRGQGQPGGGGGVQGGTGAGKTVPDSAKTGVGKVSINTASATELESLPGVGAVMAARIVAWRESNGVFTSVDALDAVPGIGPKLLAALRDLVSL